MHITTVLVFLSSVLALSFSSTPPEVNTGQTSYTDCVVKYRSAWGEDCSQCANWNDSYVVYLKNTCDESIDVMVCVQETTKKWKRFQHASMAPGDSLRAYACVGTGKYLAWGRKAGDESVVFPSIEKVNQDYKD